MPGAKKNSLERRNFLQLAAGSAAALATSVPRMEAQQAEGAVNAGGDNPYTRGMADFVADLRYDQIPAEVIERIKLLMLDSLGCALYGVDLEWSRILMRTLTQIDKTPACAVWGTALRLSAPHAALVNGLLVQGFELDDIHRVGAIHVGSVVLPALLAITEIKPGLPHRCCCRIRNRTAGGNLHGSGTPGPRLALRIDGWRIFIRVRSRIRLAALEGTDGPCLGNRRHTGFRAYGCPIWFHGQTDARRTCISKRLIRRAARGRRVHWNQERIRKR